MSGPSGMFSCVMGFGLLKETIKSCMFGRKHLHCCGNFERKWFIKDIYGCYGKNLLFCPTFKGERPGA